MSKKKNKKEKKKKQQSSKKEVAQETSLRPKLIRWGVLAVISLVVISLSLYWIPAELIYEITEVYTFSADETGTLQLTVLLPRTGHYQEISEPDINWPGTWEIHSDGRLNVLQMVIDIEAGATIEGIVSYQVNLWQGKTSWSGEPVLPEHLSPSENIQSDRNDLVEQAAELTVSDDKSATAQQIFNFTLKHLAWPREDRINADLSALNAYRSGVGGCAEHANLMIALCRAAEIPARPINGLAMPEIFPLIPLSEVWGHPAGAHGWTEIFVDHTWKLADPSWSGQFYKRDLFGWTDGKHLAYDTPAHESAVYQPLVKEAEENGTWIGAMSAPLRFVAWSDVSIESMQFIPKVTLQKTWDGRLLMVASILLIFVILDWIIGRRSVS